MPEDTLPALAPTDPEPVALTEFARILEDATHIPIEHALSDDERPYQKQDNPQDSPISSYSTAPSEVPPRTNQEQSPISSLDTEDFEHRIIAIFCSLHTPLTSTVWSRI